MQFDIKNSAIPSTIPHLITQGKKNPNLCKEYNIFIYELLSLFTPKQYAVCAKLICIIYICKSSLQ